MREEGLSASPPFLLKRGKEWLKGFLQRLLHGLNAYLQGESFSMVEEPNG